MRWAAAVGTAMLVAANAAAAAQEAEGAEVQIADISGAWKGSGFVQKDEKSKPMNVNCAIEGEQSAASIGFVGECRAMLIMKRAIGADIRLEEGQYVGTYIGSRVGVADLNGAMTSPQVLELEMTFPKEVNGDDKATMTIERPDEATFKVTTVDKMLSGVDVTTSQIVFERQ